MGKIYYCAQKSLSFFFVWEEKVYEKYENIQLTALVFFFSFISFCFGYLVATFFSWQRLASFIEMAYL